jgi:two-component system, chemotaxis family, CheB/CheR fusion protein
VPDTAPPDEQFEALLAYLRDSRGADFTGYKRPSLTRLVRRRMSSVGIDSYQAYGDLLQVESGELSALLDTLLINVTAAFRDPEAWAALGDKHLPEALAALDPDEPVRVWSAACASGEEAYSLAILLHGLLGHEDYLRRVKVYATDIDEGALATARAGRFSAQQLEGLSEQQRSTYFEPDGDALRFRQDLRHSLIFGRHDLLQDAPISRVLLLSCRNVLMYFTAETQTKVLSRFAFALHEHGLLLLGKAEMLLSQSQLFTPVDLPQRIFRARRHASAGRLALAVGGQGVDVDVRRATELAFGSAPAAQLVLDGRGLLALVNEQAQKDLGLVQADLGTAVRELELFRRPPELRAAVAAVQASADVSQLTEVAWTRGDGIQRWWDICLSPLVDEGQVLGVHLVFEDVTERHHLRERLEQVDRELTSAYEELQSSNEELETTNEELQSAVEELETTNEELQSTNEELETMNEELQSTNEELQTLNDELRDRTVEVDQVNGFLQGILTGLDLAVIVIDEEYRVQLWNSRAEQLTGLRAFEAQGRRLTELPLSLPAERVGAVLSSVVLRGESAGPLEMEICDRFGQAQSRRLRVTPLRRGRDREVRGAVVTLDDKPAADPPQE